ncbi:MAG: 30S ribosomal protein S8 [Candidatus Thermoplasmatota archaeon]|jgi:small subunit ribosomal protein S8|nr:30S ribosomal protein S8 [Candidatus Thalassarchaeaceae archaeon]MEC7364979.1 30S ribosomal protein S8 [Candidatus Thermoplasmatota archaeon]MEC7664457.1 30S ribosomal protein S8 [Candidatus Thermoplasmatota archaeon]MEC8045221.1 30S ribosomal protein S8 [Candidatus Thermoplasmatota archaeon]MEC9137607.1 30S ribosomal protein S8 [Candidatus Thermoplasmatota archaeon]|tara:strand:- start:6880 stop:7272 length:393 start_codon:yes stop_codon:yes gene_type:complete
MMQFDPLSDAFVRIYNAEQAGHYEVSINPASKLLESMLTIMQSSGYVGEFERIADGRGDAFRVELVGAINRCGVIKPRHSVKRADFDKWESRYLPARDFGLLIVSTNQGVMNHHEAKKERVGGRLLAYIF